MCVYIHTIDTCKYVYICIYGQASGVPSPPPGMCGEGSGPLELQLEGRPGVTDKARIVRKPYASHKPHIVAQYVFINLHLYFKPCTQP